MKLKAEDFEYSEINDSENVAIKHYIRCILQDT